MEHIDDMSWRKPSYSGGNGGACVEVGQIPGTVAVRDSKDREGAVLGFAPDAWEAFTAQVKADLPPEHERTPRPEGRRPAGGFSVSPLR